MNTNPWETDGRKYCFMLFKNKDAYYGYILKVENNHKVLSFSMKAAERKTYMELPAKNYHLPELTLRNRKNELIRFQFLIEKLPEIAWAA
ncbi:MAG TPA: hypothetical protein PLM72_03780 [Spirochaetota bacterium]|nr:hypothetical protein [Spirochaetota bacterium]